MKTFNNDEVYKSFDKILDGKTPPEEVKEIVSLMTFLGKYRLDNN